VVVVVVQRDADLVEVVAALRRARRLTGALHGRQEQADERADDRDHGEQFDEREARRSPPSLVNPHRRTGPLTRARATPPESIFTVVMVGLTSIPPPCIAASPRRRTAGTRPMSTPVILKDCAIVLLVSTNGT
jgi:hypothetical protein